MNKFEFSFLNKMKQQTNPHRQPPDSGGKSVERRSRSWLRFGILTLQMLLLSDLIGPARAQGKNQIHKLLKLTSSLVALSDVQLAVANNAASAVTTATLELTKAFYDDWRTGECFALRIGQPYPY